MSSDTRTNSLTFVLCLGSGVDAIVSEMCPNNDTMRKSCVTFILCVGVGVGATVGERCTKKRHNKDKLC